MQTKIQEGEAVAALMRSRNFAAVLDTLRAREVERGLTASELVVRGQALQLAESAGESESDRLIDEHNLENARVAFLQALELEPSHLQAMLELGWYYHVILDDVAKALPIFEKAVEIARANLTEAAWGYASSLAETSSDEEAKEWLQKLHTGALLRERLGSQEQEWIPSGPSQMSGAGV
jgi:tetratricopeptide (TPR) repeat protein